MWVTINANAYPTRSKFSEGRSATLATGMALALVSEISTWNILRQVIAYWLSSVPYVFVHDLPHPLGTREIGLTPERMAFMGC